MPQTAQKNKKKEMNKEKKKKNSKLTGYYSYSCNPAKGTVLKS
jgi:hypothetical protein